MQNNHPAFKLQAALLSLKNLAKEMDLEEAVYKEGTTVGQIIFHTTQAANYWVRVNILKQAFARNRDEEFSKQPSSESIEISMEKALEACEELDQANLDYLEKFEKPITVSGDNFVVDCAMNALIQITSHTNEHLSELKLQK